jgi:hypothetical protein
VEHVTPFAQTPSTPEPIIAQVRRQLADDDGVGARVPTGVLDRVADQAVRELWSSRVKTFVPVLALRTARERLRDQGVLITVDLPMMRNGEEAQAMMPRAAERTPQDIVHVESDILSLDDQDRLSL